MIWAPSAGLDAGKSGTEENPETSGDNAESLLEQINTRYNNAVNQEIGRTCQRLDTGAAKYLLSALERISRFGREW